MVRIDGGRIAARGFQYQYLRTLEVMLDLINESAMTAIRVEGGPDNENNNDVVDFDVIDAKGNCSLVVQVKSRAPGGLVSAIDIFDVLAKIIKGQDSTCYQMMTNGSPTPQAEELAAAFRACSDPSQLVQKLSTLLKKAPKRLLQLQTMDENQLDRLTRCRVLFDRRDDLEIREALRERLRTFRNNARAGLGLKSAGLLTGHLVSEILRKAADETDAIFTIEQLRSHVLIDGDQLAHLSGFRDWGAIIGFMPPLPDVVRSKLLHKLINVLADPSPIGVRRAVLVGPSGIGKSSLAAAYIADRADSYDWIFWIDGETDESILTSFRRIITYIDRDINDAESYQITASAVRHKIHTELSRFSGRWAMVFDNVDSQRQVEPWMPRAGRGDIIVTLIDSSARHGSAAVLNIGVMNPEEAVELLGRRLNLKDEDVRQFGAALHRLAAGLSYWPLALELASGYLSSCGIGLENVDDYLQRLKIRSLADSDSLPPSYPRTLAAALFLCLDQLIQRISECNNRDYRPYFAFNTIMNAAFVASRQIPIHMLAAAIVSDPDHEQVLGPVLLDPTEFNLGEVIRELRRFSLVSYDDNLPAVGALELADADRTITTNSIVQELIRIHAESDDSMPSNLDRLANHVERWLQAAFELNLLERASIISIHANTFADHLQRLNVRGKNIPLFYGNLAAICRAGGEYRRAEHLLRMELHHLKQESEPNDLLAVQAELNLIDIRFDTPGPSSISLDEADSYFGHILEHASGIRVSYPHAASKLALDASTILDRPKAKCINYAPFDRRREQLSALIADIGSTPYERTLRSIHHANSLLSEGRPIGAEKLSREALRSDYLSGPMALEAERILIEALASQDKWKLAREEFDKFKSRIGSTKLYPWLTTLFAHNVGHVCARARLIDNNADAATLLNDILHMPTVREVLEQATPGMSARLGLLAAIRDLSSGNLEDAESNLTTIPAANLHDGDDEGVQGWYMLWQMARLAIYRVRSIRYLPEHRNHQSDES